MLDYENKVLIAIQENSAKLREQLSTGRIESSVQRKLKNFAQNHGLEYEFVKYQLLTDDFFSFH